MKFHQTDLKDAWLIEIEALSDERGFFARTFCLREFRDRGIDMSVAQTNLSFNKSKNTLRGMHYNEKPHEEAKLVRCLKGGIYDVIIDLRPNSPNFTQWAGFNLTDENRQMLFIPKGFAHGFLTLEDATEVGYHMSEFYKPGVDRGIRWDDPFFGIEWPEEIIVVSEKDKKWPAFTNG